MITVYVDAIPAFTLAYNLFLYVFKRNKHRYVTPRKGIYVVISDIVYKHTSTRNLVVSNHNTQVNIP